MRNLLLAVVTLFSFNSFAQIVVGPPPPPPTLYSCNDYTLYRCDENGTPITDRRNPKYIEYVIEVCQSTPQGHGIFYTILQQVSDQICKDGKLSFPNGTPPNVTIKKITRSYYYFPGIDVIYTGDNISIAQ